MCNKDVAMKIMPSRLIIKRKTQELQRKDKKKQQQQQSASLKRSWLSNKL